MCLMMFASGGTTLKLHSLCDNQLEPVAVFNTPRLHRSQPKITHISWCHDNSYIALLQEDCQPQIISAKDRNNLSLVHTVQSITNPCALSFKSHTKRVIAFGTQTGDVILYDTKTRNSLRKFDRLNYPVRLLEFNTLDNQLAVGCDDCLHVFDDHDGVNNFVKEITLPFCTAAKFHPSFPNILGYGDKTGTVTLRNTDKNEVVSSFQKHSSNISGIAFTNDQKTMVTTGSDNKICVFDYTSMDCLFRMNIHHPIHSVDVSPDDIYIVAGLEDGCIYIYDIRNPLKPYICSNSHNGSVNKIAFEHPQIDFESPRNLAEKTSGTTLNESEYGDRIEALNLIGELDKTDEFEDKFKKDLLKMVKNHMTYLEKQLMEHCTKFQTYINNEFDSIHNAMTRWDVFGSGDTVEIVKAIDRTETKSCSSARKSSNCQ